MAEGNNSGSLTAIYNKIYWYQNRIGILNKEIDRLEEAKTAIKAIKTEANDYRKSMKVSDMIPDTSWQGTNFDEFSAAVDSIRSSADIYHEGVDEVLDAVCDAITDREKEKTNGLIIIDQLWDSYWTIRNAAEKLTN